MTVIDKLFEAWYVADRMRFYRCAEHVLSLSADCRSLRRGIPTSVISSYLLGDPPRIPNPPLPRKTQKNTKKHWKMHRIYPPDICVPPEPAWNLELTLLYRLWLENLPHRCQGEPRLHRASGAVNCRLSNQMNWVLSACLADLITSTHQSPRYRW